MTVYVCVCLFVSVPVSVECSVDGRLYMTRQLLDAVIAKNVYDETNDAANETRSWLNGVADWLFSLNSRFSLIF